MKLRSLVFIFVLLGMGMTPALASTALSDKQVRKRMIKESIAAYPGNCPCPYSINRAGRACSRSSAYSKPGGRAPLCYPSDINDEMVHTWRTRNR
jgi:hypothetical protein